MVEIKSFDMDLHVKKNQPDKPLMAVSIRKKTAKSRDEYFIVVKKGDCFSPSLFHGIGFFWSPQPNEYLEDINKVDLKFFDYEEVWIPYENVDYIKSLTYVKR